MSWGGSYVVGQRIVMDVHFEWSECNQERHVYSPQIGFPGLQYLLSLEAVNDAVSYVNSGYSEITWDDSGGNVMIKIERMSEPVNLTEANCTVTSGAHSWAAEYVDLLGWYSSRVPADSITTLGQDESVGGMITYQDANRDGYLDDGDFFVVSDLQKPSADSGIKTYLFRCQWEEDQAAGKSVSSQVLAYLVVTNRGVVTHDKTLLEGNDVAPNAILRSSYDGHSARFTVSELSHAQVKWSETEIYFTHIGGYETIRPAVGDLRGGSPTTKVYPDFIMADTISSWAITDLSGNDVLDDGDYFVLSPSSGNYAEGLLIDLGLLYTPKGIHMAHTSLTTGEVPISDLSISAVSGGVKCEFSNAMHNDEGWLNYTRMDVSWSEITIEVSDGCNTALWNPHSDDLATGALTTFPLSIKNLGDLGICIIATDLQGNGYVNRGDSLEIVALTGGTFSAEKSYSVTIKHNATNGTICSANFSG